ncbi:MAG TPA: DUF1697 domain-containing protein [Candidatus Acidoferrum sp.]|jgi:uncharacterized protein (DUF1697 family)|nr:DUF1697 domain-containing protein [Candidatus Acidoferrum sp.]
MVAVSLLRGVNLGPHRRVRMEPLRAVYEGLGLRNVQTLLQSGNVLFCCAERGYAKLGARIEDAIEREFGFRAAAVQRTASELRDVVARNPFAERPNIDPSKLLVDFLGMTPDADAQARLTALRVEPEEIRIVGSELYIYYPNGMARPKLTPAQLDRALGKLPATGRNWNTVTKLAELAGRIEASEK